MLAVFGMMAVAIGLDNGVLPMQCRVDLIYRRVSLDSQSGQLQTTDFDGVLGMCQIHFRSDWRTISGNGNLVRQLFRVNHIIVRVGCVTDAGRIVDCILFGRVDIVQMPDKSGGSVCVECGVRFDSRAIGYASLTWSVLLVVSAQICGRWKIMEF